MAKNVTFFLISTSEFIFSIIYKILYWASIFDISTTRGCYSRSYHTVDWQIWANEVTHSKSLTSINKLTLNELKEL